MPKCCVVFMTILTVALGYCSVSLGASSDDEDKLRNAMKFWRGHDKEGNEVLPFCDWSGGRYPSKQDPNPNVEMHGNCNDGDGVIFNGVLCAAGETISCDTVRRSQNRTDKYGPEKVGEWFRSPRKVGVGGGPTETDFSPDHSLGVWAYIAERQDADAYRLWVKWMDTQPRPRYCPDDQCTFSFGDCPMLDRLGVIVGAANPVCDPQHKATDTLLKLSQDQFDSVYSRATDLPGWNLIFPQIDAIRHQFNAQLELLKQQENTRMLLATYARAASGAAGIVDQVNTWVNSAGSGEWDAGVAIWLLKKYGVAPGELTEPATVLTIKEPHNAFFRYVESGKTEETLGLIVKGCPLSDDDWSGNRKTEWIWERPDNKQPPAKDNTVFWDCLAVAKLYFEPVNGVAPLQWQDVKSDLENAEKELYKIETTLQTLIDNMDDLLKDCEAAKCVAVDIQDRLKQLKDYADGAINDLHSGEIPPPPDIASLTRPPGADAIRRAAEDLGIPVPVNPQDLADEAKRFVDDGLDELDHTAREVASQLGIELPW
jgi:hypothetical protein